MTNFERIKGFDIEEMSKFIGRSDFVCCCCKFDNDDFACNNNPCVKGYQIWLESESE